MLTIWHNGSESAFVAGHEVIIGPDVRADVRVADPRISRAHVVLRFEQGTWVAVDNGSVNVTFVNGYRLPVIDVHSQSINIGNAGGPQLPFEIGVRRRKGGPPPASGRPRTTQQTMSWSTAWSPVPPTLLPQDQFWGAHPTFLAARHGHAGWADGVLRGLRPVEDPAAPLGADDRRHAPAQARDV